MQNSDEQMSRPPMSRIVWGIVLNASIPLILYKLSTVGNGRSGLARQYVATA